MAEKKTIKAAIVGYGLAGAVFHAPVVAATPGMEVAAVVTRDKDRAEQARKNFPKASLLESADQIWNNASAYDLVVIAAPNRVHAALGEAALKAGIPVVIDKPMVTSVVEAKRLIKLSKSTGTLLTVFHNRRWDSDFQTVQKLLQEDLLGMVTRFESRIDRYRPVPREGTWRENDSPEEAGGLLFDLGSHLIDQAIVLFGHPLSVYAEINNRRPGAKVDDDTFVALRFGNGVNAHLWVSSVARSPGPRFRVMGLRGTYEKWGVDPQEAALREGGSPNEMDWGREPSDQWGHLLTDIDGAEIDVQWESVPGDWTKFYSLLRDAILEDGPPPVDPVEALMTQRIIEAAIESAVSCKTVSL